MIRKTKRTNSSGWLTLYFKLRKMGKRFTYLVICHQDMTRVSKHGAVNFTKS